MLSKISGIKATFFIIAIWCILFISDQFFGLFPLLCGKGLHLMGGQYNRIFTGALLHTNFIHLAVNCGTLFWVGRFLEKNIGIWKYLSFGIVCCFLAQLVFMSVYPNVSGSAGGSPLIFSYLGLISALQIFDAGFPRFRPGTWYGNWILIYAVAANIPLFSWMDSSALAIHFIAFATGFVMGSILAINIKGRIKE